MISLKWQVMAVPFSVSGERRVVPADQQVTEEDASGHSGNRGGEFETKVHRGVFPIAEFLATEQDIRGHGRTRPGGASP